VTFSDPVEFLGFLILRFTMANLVFARLLKFRFWIAVAVLSAAFSPTSSLGQIVASGITGMVIDEAGRPIAGANVTAVHTG